MHALDPAIDANHDGAISQIEYEYFTCADCVLGSICAQPDALRACLPPYKGGSCPSFESLDRPFRYTPMDPAHSAYPYASYPRRLTASASTLPSPPLSPSPLHRYASYPREPLPLNSSTGLPLDAPDGLLHADELWRPHCNSFATFTNIGACACRAWVRGCAWVRGWVRVWVRG